jgi:hypothetical protein
VLKTVFLVSALGVCAFAQNAPEKAAESKGLPPRAAPGDYQAQGKAGAVTIAAEFTGHAVPTAAADPLNTDDYIAVETALFGSANAHAIVSSDDFSLRVNGAKKPLASVPFAAVFKSLKDPDWEPPAKAAEKSKNGISGTAGASAEPNLPAIVHIPIEIQHAMQQKVQKAALPEGDRALPAAGLIFFPYHGKASGIHSVELMYSGPAGKVTIPLQP